RGHCQRALQRAAAGIARGSHLRAGIGRAQIAKLVLDPNHRLLGKGHARRRDARRLGLNGQMVRRRWADAKGSALAGAQSAAAGRRLNWLPPTDLTQYWKKSHQSDRWKSD